MNWKNIRIILAGGCGTRLSPLTKLLASFAGLQQANDLLSLDNINACGHKEFLIITNDEYKSHFFNLLGDGSI